MKLIMENWKRYLTENEIPFVKHPKRKYIKVYHQNAINLFDNKAGMNANLQAILSIVSPHIAEAYNGVNIKFYRDYIQDAVAGKYGLDDLQAWLKTAKKLSK